jgi:ferric-dicitrate binding protein FerR (iron transport regulator)
MNGCSRWIEIADRAAIGDPVSDEEVRLQREHEALCASCSAERKVWDALEALGGVAHVDSRPRFLPPLARRRHRRPLVVGIAMAAAVVFAAFWSRERARPRLTAGGDARFVISTGQAEAGTDHLLPGNTIGPGVWVRAVGDATCIAVDFGVRACLDPASEARVVDTRLAHRVLELRSGCVRVTLDHQPAGSFGIATIAGTATATGTAFSVEIDDSRATIALLRVSQGVVMVNAPGLLDQAVGMGEQTVIGSGVTRRTGSNEEDHEESPTPSDMRESPHEHPVAPAPMAVVRRPSVDAGASSAPPLDAGIPTSAELLDAGIPTSAELLAEAGALRGQGEPRQAAEVYRRLQALHPESVEAHTSFMLLGEMELDQLSDPSAALRSFEEYLSSGGSLCQEAELGRIRSLRALGRRADELEASESFLARYPSSVHASSLRARVRTITAAP